MNFYNTFLVNSTVDCGEFHQGIRSEILNSDFLNMILKYYFLIESYGESFRYIYLHCSNNFIKTSMGT